MGEKIGLDTSFFIYYLEEHSEYLRPARAIIDKIEAGHISAVFSCVGLVEVLTGPKRLGRYDLARKYQQLITHFPNLTISGVNEEIVELASDLRAQYEIRTPDAILLATAIDFGATRFISNDRALQRVKEIVVEAL